MFNKNNNKVYNSYYNILGTEICLESPRKEINEYCNFLLKDFTCEKLSCSTSLIKVEEDIILEGHYNVYKNGITAQNLGMELCAIEYSILPTLLENIISGHAINQVDKKNLITLHAGSMTKNAEGILILGESGHGKSTLTLEMVANHDWGYLSDEIGLIDTGFNLQPFPKTISFIPGVVKLNPDWKLKKYGIKHQVEIPAGNYGSPAPLKAVFFIKYIKEREPEIKLIKKSDSLAMLNKAQIGRAKYSASLERMAEVVKRIDSYVIIHNNCTRAAGLIEKVMDEKNV
jgi:hypothetical protein